MPSVACFLFTASIEYSKAEKACLLSHFLVSISLCVLPLKKNRTGSDSLGTANYKRIRAVLHQRPPHLHSSLHTPTHTQTSAYIFGIAFSEVHYEWQNYYPLWQHVCESTTRRESSAHKQAKKLGSFGTLPASSLSVVSLISGLWKQVMWKPFIHRC